jgi:hypothetical protein
MQIRNSIRSTIRLLILIGILVLIGFTPGCQTTKENTLPEKINNPNGRNDAWGFIGAGGGVWYGPAKGDDNAVEDIIMPS